MRRRAGIAALLGVLMGLLVPPATASAPSRLLVTAHEYSLQLSRPKLAPGAAIVQFLNSGEDPHDLVVKRVGGSRTFGAGPTGPGELAQFDAHLRRGRRYVLYCSLADHRQLGMQAHLTVRRRR
jgi:hypothetical protein